MCKRKQGPRSVIFFINFLYFFSSSLFVLFDKFYFPLFILIFAHFLNLDHQLSSKN